MLDTCNQKMKKNDVFLKTFISKKIRAGTFVSLVSPYGNVPIAVKGMDTSFGAQLIGTSFKQGMQRDHSSRVDN